MKSKSSENTKKKIIDATLELLREAGNTNEVSVRKIVQKAGIKGVGIINYHFRTKDKLISEAIRYDTNMIIDRWDAIYETMKMPSIDKLKIMLKGTGDLIDTNPLFGRISMIHDYLNPAVDDNTSRSIDKYMMIFREIYGDNKPEEEIMIIAHTLLSSAQLAFIRSDVIQKTTGYDFYDKKQRDEFLEILIDNLIQSM
ncbi:MAG: TetR/AcrR family transcriptional regulator [Asgard group archaeon]|nr:TetR/AcrR family transcriptional regulator [Asgard group archaeon]